MAMVIFGIFGGQLPQKRGWIFWFLMQMAMMAGFVFAYPANMFNMLLIRCGVKRSDVDRTMHG